MMFTSLKNSKKGFTLIELLVVIAIIGILSSVVLASLSTARAKSRDAKRVSDVGQIQLALELFFDAYQSYPSTTPSWSSCSPACTGIDGGQELLTYLKFLPQTPVPPAGGATYYAYAGVTSAGANCVGASSCIGYALGTDLERSDNTVLTTDSGQNVTNIDVPTAGDDFYGESGGACVGAATVAGADKCYDVKP